MEAKAGCEVRTFYEIREEVFAKYPICKDAGRWLIPGAIVAKIRLINVIEEDRRAVPCGRWVRCFPAQRKWQLLAEQALFCGRPIPMPPYGKELRPRYRWSERR